MPYLFSESERNIDADDKALYTRCQVNGLSNPNERSVLLNENKPVPRSYEVASVRKALELLGCFTTQSPAWTLSDLARSLHIPKSTVHNLLRTLQSFDLVRQDTETRVYRLGPGAMELGLVFARSSDILSHGRAVLGRLAELTRETVKLGVLSNDQVLIIAAVESSHQLHTRGDTGTRWPLHSSSLGKAILSVLPEDEAGEILARKGMSRFTSRTLTTWEELEREIKRIRASGYALDQEENEPGVCCVAAPVTDALHGIVAAISISGPSVRIKNEVLEELAKHVMAAGRAVVRQVPRKGI
jgi:DNA-binding IclR family transcriptional regulator